MLSPLPGQVPEKRPGQASFSKELEKAVADFGKTPKVAKEAPAGRKVAVCGAGPAGLTASYHLSLQGCQVTVFDPGGHPGGFLKDVRPEKLPPEVLEREISRSAISGVQFRMKAASLDADRYDLTIVDRTAYQAGSEGSAGRGGIDERWRPSAGH